MPVVGDDIWRLFKLYRHYEKAVLLYSGGLLDQPNAYIESMELIAEALNDGSQ